MFHSPSLATPTQPPIASHQRGSRLASSRVTRYSVTVQNRKSAGVVVSSCAAPMYSPHVAAASAASTWPVRPGPEPPAHRGREHDIAARQSAGTTRRPTSGVAAEHRPDPRQQRRQRRLVNVAEGEVLAGGEEVQLVPDISVAAADGQFQRDRAERDQRDRQPRRAHIGGRAGGTCCPGVKRFCSHVVIVTGNGVAPHRADSGFAGSARRRRTRRPTARAPPSWGLTAPLPLAADSAQPTCGLYYQGVTSAAGRMTAARRGLADRLAALPERRQEQLQDAGLAVALAAVNVVSVLPYRAQLHPLWLALVLLAGQALPLIWRRSAPVGAGFVIGAARISYDKIGFGFAPLPLGPAIAVYTVFDRRGPVLRAITAVLVVVGVTISLRVARAQRAVRRDLPGTDLRHRDGGRRAQPGQARVPARRAEPGRASRGRARPGGGPRGGGRAHADRARTARRRRPPRQPHGRAGRGGRLAAPGRSPRGRGSRWTSSARPRARR